MPRGTRWGWHSSLYFFLQSFLTRAFPGLSSGLGFEKVCRGRFPRRTETPFPVFRFCWGLARSTQDSFKLPGKGELFFLISCSLGSPTKWVGSSEPGVTYCVRVRVKNQPWENAGERLSQAEDAAGVKIWRMDKSQ